MPERARLPIVVTVHDMTFFDHPEWHERSKVLVFRRAIAVAARRAAAIVCVSEATARRLSERCRVRGRIFVAPHGVDLERFGPTEPEVGADAGELRRLGLPGDRPYVAFVGTVEPRKHVQGLVRAFDRIAGRHPDLLLVVAGHAGWGERTLAEAIAASPHREQIRRLGYVADRAVPALLRQAAVVAYPSFEEGYGLPALEALACGAPLVTTEGTAMAELAGPAAWLVPPGGVEELAEAIESVVGDGVAPEGLAERRRMGLQLAGARTWTASAARHLEAYRFAAEAAS
jgi:glycosyltransferase involved in cell wall biosynthesis